MKRRQFLGATGVAGTILALLPGRAQADSRHGGISGPLATATMTLGSWRTVSGAPEAMDCPDQSSPPARPSWCRSPKDTWGAANWSVEAATVERRPNTPQGMMSAGWLPTDTFAKQWASFVTQPEHPVTLPP